MSKKGLFALMVGIAAGTATGVLFSPTSGKKFREKLKKEIDSGGYGKKSLYTHFTGLAKDIKETAETEVKKSGLDKKAANVVKKVNRTTKKVVSKAKSVEKNLEKKVNKVKKTALKASKKATKVASKVEKKLTPKKK